MKFVAALRKFATVWRDASALELAGKAQGKVGPPTGAIHWQTFSAPERLLFFFAPTKRTENRNDDILLRSQLRARW